MSSSEELLEKGILRDLSPEDGQTVQEFLEACDDYSQVTYGLPTGAADAQSLYLTGLEHVPDEQKVLQGLWRHGQLDAVSDALIGHPDEDTLSVGLLLVRPSCRSSGIGALLLARLEQLAVHHGLARIIIHGHVLENTQATTFWERHGYSVRETTPVTVNATQPRTRALLEKNLSLHS